MNQIDETEPVNDKQRIEQLLVELGFTCNSSPSAQNMIYTKDGEVIMIKNTKK